jgi:hypothetical protein
MLRVSPDPDRTKLTTTQVQQLATFFRVAPGAIGRGQKIDRT